MKNSNSRTPILVSVEDEPNTFSVEVRAATTTRHRVTVTAAFLRQLGLEASEPARVLQEAFAFLLEREPNTSVLAEFDLRDIERYFPEFRHDIAQRLRG